MGQTTIAGQTEAPVEPAREAVPTPAAQPESSDEATDTESVVPGAGPTEATPTQAAPAAGRDSALSAADIEAHLDRTFTIRFEMDSNDFSDDAFQLMNRLAKVAKQTPDLRVSISGYTDSLGNYDYNRRLSEFRANVVKSYLIGQGVSPSQVRTFGRGPDNPIESNETREGRAANRRVEIVLHRGSVD